MEKRIQLEMRGKSPSQVTELVIDNCRSTNIDGLTDEFVNLKSLSASDVGLTSLKGFPKLPNLKKLELSENRIPGGLEILVNNCPNIVSLNLSANKIATLDLIEPLKDLKNLMSLDLCQCDVSHLDNYREKVFELLPNIKFLDGFDKDEKESIQSEGELEKAGKSAEDGSEEDDSEDLEDEEDMDGELDESEEVDLSYLGKENIDEESEGEDYSPEDEDDDDEVDDGEEEDSESDGDVDATPRGEKRKHEE